MDPLRQENQIPADPSIPHETGNEHHALPLRTLSSDLAEAVRRQQGSAIKIAIAEDERRAKDREAISPTSKKNLTFIVAGVSLLLLAGAGTGFALWYKQHQAAAVPVATAPIAASVLRSDATDTIDTTGKTSTEIANAFRSIVANPGLRLGTVKNVLVTQTVGATATRVPANLFLASLGAHISPEFSRALGQDYMLGMYYYDRTNGVIVLTGTAHDYLLSGMLAWEPYMVQDLAPLLGVDTSGTNATILNAKFADTLVENHTTRAVVDANNKPVLFYSFLDEDTLFISTDGKTLTEAVRRLHQ